VLELLRICVREFGQTVVMASHDVAAAAFAEQTVLLSDGRVAGKVSNPTTRSILTALEALDVRVGIE
jgi:ABC transporter, ATP-binding protein